MKEAEQGTRSGDMGDSSSAFMKLRRVTFLCKPEYEKGWRTLQDGLIADEVADLYRPGR